MSPVFKPKIRQIGGQWQISSQIIGIWPAAGCMIQVWSDFLVGCQWCYILKEDCMVTGKEPSRGENISQTFCAISNPSRRKWSQTMLFRSDEKTLQISKSPQKTVWCRREDVAVAPFTSEKNEQIRMSQSQVRFSSAFLDIVSLKSKLLPVFSCYGSFRQQVLL